MSFVMFWSSECLLMGVICFLPLPCSPTPRPPLPASSFPISPLFACCSSCSTPPSSTAMSSPCVLRHCAQHWTCSSWLVSLLSSICLSLFFLTCILSLCSMPSFTVAHKTLLLEMSAVCVLSVSHWLYWPVFGGHKAPAKEKPDYIWFLLH